MIIISSTIISSSSLLQALSFVGSGTISDRAESAVWQVRGVEWNVDSIILCT